MKFTSSLIHKLDYSIWKHDNRFLCQLCNSMSLITGHEPSRSHILQVTFLWGYQLAYLQTWICAKLPTLNPKVETARVSQEVWRQILLLPLQSTECWYYDTSKFYSNTKRISDIDIVQIFSLQKRGIPIHTHLI